MQGMKRMGDNNGGIDGPKKMRNEDTVTLRFLLMSKHAGGIIGKGGVTIKKLRADFNASVNVPDSQGNERVLSVQATQDDAIKVLVEVLPLCHEPPYSGQSGQNAGSCEFEINFLVHSSQVGGIIGRGGFKIKELRETTGCQVKVFQECLGCSTERVVAIAGSQDELVACLQQILMVMQESPIKGPIMLYDPANSGFDNMYGGGMGNNMGRGGGRGGRGGRGTNRGNFGGNNANQNYGGFGGRGGGNMGGGGFNNMGGNMGGMGGGMGNMGGMGQMGQMGGMGDGFNMMGSQQAAANPMSGPPQDMMAGTGYDYSTGQQTGATEVGAGMGGDMQTTQVTIPKDVAGAIIGRGGERIRNIRQKCCAEIKIEEPKEDSKDRLITITGNHSSIQYAQFLMQQSVRQYGQTTPGGQKPGGF